MKSFEIKIERKKASKLKTLESTRSLHRRRRRQRAAAQSNIQLSIPKLTQIFSNLHKHEQAHKHTQHKQTYIRIHVQTLKHTQIYTNIQSNIHKSKKKHKQHYQTRAYILFAPSCQMNAVLSSSTSIIPLVCPEMAFRSNKRIIYFVTFEPLLVGYKSNVSMDLEVSFESPC